MPASPLPKKWSITGAGNHLFGTRDTPWGKAVEAFTRNAITHRRRLLSAAAACALIAAVAKSFNPAPYLSTAQLLIDPRGFRVFSTDLSGGVFDANAAINFVESQMVVLRSDRVLLNVVRSENQAAAKAANAPSAAAAKSADATETKALTALRRAVTVQRGERSFIVNVSASHEAPDGSARLANSVVEAFIREETSGRSERAVRLRGDFSSREDGLRKNLQQAEINVEAFRLSKGLVGLHDRTLLEQQLTQSITALGAAEAMEARSQARMMQLEVDPGTLGTGGRLEADMASRDIVVKLEGLTKARAELHNLSSVLGEKHPSLSAARTRVDEHMRDLTTSLDERRKAAHGDIDQARREATELKRNIAELSEKLSSARKAEIELNALEREAEGRRKIFDAFQTRSREASEFGEIDATNIRIVSAARAPADRSRIPGIMLWTLIGGMMGALLAMATLALATIRDMAPAPGPSDR